MGCSASVARPPSTAALDPGELRDRSLQPTVVLHAGVAQAGARGSTPPQQQPQPPPHPQQHGPPGGASQQGGSEPAAAAAAARAAPPAGAARTPSEEAAAAEAEAPAVSPPQSMVVPEPAAPPAANTANPAPQQPPASSSSSSAGAAAAAAAADPAARAQPRMQDCAVSLSFLIRFCRTVPEDMPTWRVVTDVVVPETRARGCRYVETLEARDVGPCDYFISHRWASPFSHLVGTVRKHLVELGDVEWAEGGGGEGAEGAERAAGAEGVGVGTADDEPAQQRRTADQVFVWCDIFAINQHPGQVQADDLAQLKDCVEASQQTLLCLDDKGMVLTRIWCLYEIWNTVLAGGAPKLAVLGYDVNQDAFKEVYITLDVAEAQATVESDRLRILEDIAASTGVQELNMVIKGALVESTQAEADNAQKVLLPAAKDYRDFTRVMEAINKHTQMLVAIGRSQEAARYSYIVQSISNTWQKDYARTNGDADAERPRKGTGAGAGGGGGSPAGGGEGAGGAAAAAVEGDGSPPSWHWSTYPRDPELRKAVSKAQAAEAHARFDDAMQLYKDAVARAEELHQASTASSAPAPALTGPSAPSAACHLDLGGCRLHLAALMTARGYIQQARTDGGEAGVAAFEAAAGGGSLTYASAALQLAVLCKHDWQSKDLRTQLVEASYDICCAQLGPNHPAALDALAEKAELTAMGGDMAAGVRLFHQLAVGLSGGRDLLAPPPPPLPSPPSATGPTPAAGTGAAPPSACGGEELGGKAVDAWFRVATYGASLPGAEEQTIAVCRALVPQKRRQHLRRLRAAVASGGELAEAAAAALAALPPAAGAPGGAASGDAGADPAGLWDPDDPRVDFASNIAEIHTWATALGKLGRLEESVRLQWRLADVIRGSKEMRDTEMQLPSGKVNMAEAYERCLLLDMTVPGVAAVAAGMRRQQQQQHNHPQHHTTSDNTGGSTSGADGADAGGADAAAVPDGGGGPAAPAGGGTAAVRQPVYDGPGYLELITRMSELWGKMEWGGAEAVCRQIVACQESGHGAVSKAVVDARSQLATLLRSAGRQGEAVAEMRACLAVHGRLLGGKDPAMRNTMQALADMLEDRAEAEQLHKRAVALVEKVYGPAHMDVGLGLISYGSFLMGWPEGEGGAGESRMAEGQALISRGTDIQMQFQAQQVEAARAH